MLKYRKIELSLQEKAHKNLVKKETQKAQAITSLVQTAQIYDKGKSLDEDLPQTISVETLNALMQTTAEMEKIFAMMS